MISPEAWHALPITILREDELFAAIATNIIEFAGLDDKAPWIITVVCGVASLAARRLTVVDNLRRR